MTTKPDSPRRTRPPQVLRVLAIPGFTRLLASQALFDIGAVARTAAQSWVMYDLTGSNLWVGLASGMRSIPILIFPIFAGAIADRIDKRKLLALVRIGLAAVSIIQAILIALDIIQPWHMLALALAAGTVVAFAMPAFWAYIADIVAPRALPRATALIMMGENAGEMVGPVIVGWIIATAGADWAYGIIAAIYLLGAIFILNAPKGRYATTKTEDEDEDKPSYYESVKQGIAYARKSPTLPWLFIMNASVNVTGVAIFPLMPEYATKILDVGPVGFGVMSAALGIGLAIGSIIIAILGLPRRVIWIIIVSSFIWDFGMIGFGFSRIYPLTLALLFIMGIAGMFWVNAIINLYQREAIGNMRGTSNVPIHHRSRPLPTRLDLRRHPLSPHRQRTNPHHQRPRRHTPNPPSHAPNPRPPKIITPPRHSRAGRRFSGRNVHPEQ